jgi:hypothetical protein
MLRTRFFVVPPFIALFSQTTPQQVLKTILCSEDSCAVMGAPISASRIITFNRSAQRPFSKKDSLPSFHQLRVSVKSSAYLYFSYHRFLLLVRSIALVLKLCQEIFYFFYNRLIFREKKPAEAEPL